MSFEVSGGEEQSKRPFFLHSASTQHGSVRPHAAFLLMEPSDIHSSD